MGDKPPVGESGTARDGASGAAWDGASGAARDGASGAARDGAAQSLWVGRDEHEGVPAQPRRDLRPPAHWRLEAIAATPRPRSLALGADRRYAVFIEDGGDTSDLWLLD